jgi:hypothetical protein
MDYASLSFTEVQSALRDVARDAHATFGDLDVSRLNWRPTATQWSVAQCFEHLVTANALMLKAANDALEHSPTSVWQRVPVWPRLVGRARIRSQAPETTRKFTAPAKARPTTSDLPGDIIQRFVDQHRRAVDWMRTVDGREIERRIMLSPFIRIVTYSVLDGCRLLVAHDRRHFEQARRVLDSPEFPRSPAAPVTIIN